MPNIRKMTLQYVHDASKPHQLSELEHVTPKFSY